MCLFQVSQNNETKVIMWIMLPFPVLRGSPHFPMSRIVTVTGVTSRHVRNVNTADHTLPRPKQHINRNERNARNAGLYSNLR